MFLRCRAPSGTRRSSQDRPRQLGPRLDSERPEDTRQVRFHGVDAHEQGVRDLPVRLTRGGKLGDPSAPCPSGAIRPGADSQRGPAPSAPVSSQTGAPSRVNDSVRGLERLSRGGLLARPATNIAEREPGQRPPKGHLQALVDQDGLFGGSDGAREVSVGGKDERPSPERLRERRAGASPSRPPRDGLDDASGLVRSGRGPRGPPPRAPRSAPNAPEEPPESRLRQHRAESFVRAAQGRRGTCRASPGPTAAAVRTRGLGEAPRSSGSIAAAKRAGGVDVATPDGEVEPDDHEVL